MATINEELTKLESTKADIKSALVEKGLNPTDEFSSYALNIRDILSGGSTEPVNAYAIFSDSLKVKWPTNWASEKCIVFYSNNINLPDLTIKGDLIPDLIFCQGNEIRFNVNWNLTIVYESKYIFSYGNIMSSARIAADYSEYDGVFNINLNGNESTRAANSLFAHLYGKIHITCNNIKPTTCINLFDGCTFGDFSCTGLDTSQCTNFVLMFRNCQFYNQSSQGLLDFLSSLDTSKGTDFSSMFDYSYLYGGNTIKFPSLDTSKGTNFSRMFEGCGIFNEIEPLDTSNGTDLLYMFGGMLNLIKIHEISIKSLNGNLLISSSYLFDWGDLTTLRYALIKDIGYDSNTTSFKPCLFVMNWGVEDASIPLSAGARQSVIDSLITYSFDRAAAGYDACTISLSANTKALLTEEEIAQITAKGYTLA